MKKIIAFLGIVFMVSFLAFCGKSKEQKQAEKATKQLKTQIEKVAKGMEEFGKQMNAQKVVEPVDFKILEQALPEMDGWTKSTPKGEKVKMGNMSYSTASAQYTKDGIRVSVTLTDSSGISALLVPFKAMMNLGLESESEEGYQKVITIGNSKAIERYEKNKDKGEITLIYNGRFIIAVSGYGFKSPDDLKILKNFVEKIDLSKLK